MPKLGKIKYTTAYPTSIIVNGLDMFGYQLAKSLTEQGGYVIIIDNLEDNHMIEEFTSLRNIAFLDFDGIADMVEEMRRLDYVFYLNHSTFNPKNEISSQDFLSFSNYLDQILKLASDFNALFSLTNSIEAHKVLLSANKFENLKSDDPAKDYLNYSNAEFVRYSENIVSEYRKTRNLNAKILRLGVLLGEGVHLSKNTNIGKLIYQAVGQKDLVLDEDGLSSEHYIHLVDAVYGVIKAQFSRDIKDYIFTIAYPDPITQLSLAYKIQEIEPDAGEIKFVDEENSKVRLGSDIYKAAKNLSKIGWHTKVDFETALLQTISYIKSLLEQEVQEEIKDAEMIDIDDTSYSYDKYEDERQVKNGALARLIEERKQAENQRKEKLVLSASKLKKSKAQTSFRRRLKKAVVKRYDNFAKNFKFLQKLTVGDMLMYSLLLGIFLFLFFVFISPLALIIRDFVGFNSAVETYLFLQENGQWDDAQLQADDAQKSVKSLISTLENSDLLFQFIGREDLQSELLAACQSASFISDSFSNSSLVADQIQETSNQKYNEIVYRPTNTSLLSIRESEETNEGAETENVQNLRSIEELQAANSISIRSYNNAKNIYQQVDSTRMPYFLQSYFNNFYNNLVNYREFLDDTNQILGFLNETNEGKFSIGFVIQDSIRTNFSGGTLTSIGLIEYSNGEIKNVNLLPINNVQKVALSDLNLNQNELDEIVKLSQGKVTLENINDGNVFVQDVVEFVHSSKTTFSLIEEYLEESFKSKPDVVFRLNSAAFGEMLETFGEISINDKKISSENYLQQINILQEDSVSSRNLIMTNLSAILISRFNEQTRSNAFQMRNLFESIETEGGLILNDEFKEILGIEEDQKDIEIAINRDSVENYTVNPLLDLNISTELSAGKAYSTGIFNTQNTQDVDDMLICFDKDFEEFDLKNIPAERYLNLGIRGKDCYLFDIKAAKRYEFSYESNYKDETYGNIIGIVSGVELRYDIEIEVPSTFNIVSSTPEANKQDASYFYFGGTYDQFKFRLNFQKDE